MSLLPSQAARQVVGYAVLAGALVAAGGGLVWWGLAPRIDLAKQEAASVANDLQAARAVIQAQTDQLHAAQVQGERIHLVETMLAQLSLDMNKYSRAQSRALEELKKNDDEVVRYLAGAVPSSLGRLYERPETTDPRAYGSPAILRPDTLPTAGPASAGAE